MLDLLAKSGLYRQRHSHNQLAHTMPLTREIVSINLPFGTRCRHRGMSNHQRTTFHTPRTLSCSKYSRAVWMTDLLATRGPHRQQHLLNRHAGTVPLTNLPLEARRYHRGTSNHQQTVGDPASCHSPPILNHFATSGLNPRKASFPKEISTLLRQRTTSRAISFGPCSNTLVATTDL